MPKGKDFPMKKRMVQLCIVGCVLIVPAFFLTASAQDQSARNSGVDLIGLPWGQIMSMIAVISVIFGMIQWIITVQLIQPQIRAAVTSSSSDVKTWAAAEFTPKRLYDIHLLEDKQAHESIRGQIADVVHDQAQDNERIQDLHDKSIVHEGKIERLETGSRVRGTDRQ